MKKKAGGKPHATHKGGVCSTKPRVNAVVRRGKTVVDGRASADVLLIDKAFLERTENEVERAVESVGEKRRQWSGERQNKKKRGSRPKGV